MFNVLGAYYTALNGRLSTVFISTTTPDMLASTAGSWDLYMTAPGAVSMQLLGSMQLWPNSSEADGVTNFAWRTMVPAANLSAVSPYMSQEQPLWRLV